MKRLRIMFLLLLAMTCLDRGIGQTQSLEILQLKTKIPLPGVEGRIDHMDIDLKTQRVFVAALGNNTVEVVSLRDEKRLNTIEGFHEPQGVLFLPERNQLYITNGGNGTCEILDAASFKRVKSIGGLDDADNIRYNKSTNLIYVAYGTGGVVSIDPVSMERNLVLPLKEHPESFQLETSGNRMYINVPNEKKIVVFENRKQRSITSWPLKDADKNYPMTLDEQHHMLYVGCRAPARLLVIDMRTGKLVSTIPIGEDVDDVFYDVERHLLYISCGRGIINVFAQESQNTYKQVEQVQTRKGARTSVFVPSLNMLIVAAPKNGNEEAQLFVYTIKSR
jgi:hypothetical protein